MVSDARFLLLFTVLGACRGRHSAAESHVLKITTVKHNGFGIFFSGGVILGPLGEMGWAPENAFMVSGVILRAVKVSYGVCCGLCFGSVGSLGCALGV